MVTINTAVQNEVKIAALLMSSNTVENKSNEKGKRATILLSLKSMIASKGAKIAHKVSNKNKTRNKGNNFSFAAAAPSAPSAPQIPKNAAKVLEQLQQLLAGMSATDDPTKLIAFMEDLEQKLSSNPPYFSKSAIKDITSALNNAKCLHSSKFITVLKNYFALQAFNKFKGKGYTPKQLLAKMVAYIKSLMNAIPSSLIGKTNTFSSKLFFALDTLTLDHGLPLSTDIGTKNGNGWISKYKDYSSDEMQMELDGKISNYVYNPVNDFNSQLHGLRQSAITSLVNGLGKTKNDLLLIMLIFVVIMGYSSNLEDQVGSQGKLADKMTDLSSKISTLLNQAQEHADQKGDPWTPAKALQFVNTMKKIQNELNDFKYQFGTLTGNIASDFDAINKISIPYTDSKDPKKTTLSLADAIKNFENATPGSKEQATAQGNMAKILNSIYPASSKNVPTTVPLAFTTMQNNLKQATELFTNQSQIVGTETQKINDKINTDTGFGKNMFDQVISFINTINDNIKSHTNG
jgi:hypothetical protein